MIGKFKTRSFLRVDYSMEMWSGRWVAFLPIVSAVAVCFLVGLPAYIGWVLAYYRKSLYSPKIMSTYGFLYSRYRVGSEWWEVHEIVRKMLLCGALVYLPEIAQAAITSLVSVCALVSLNYHRPYRNSWIFFACESAFLSTCMKYIMLLVLLANKGARDNEANHVIGWIMLSGDIFVLLASLAALFAMLAAFRIHMKKLKDSPEGIGSVSPTALKHWSRVKVYNAERMELTRKPSKDRMLSLVERVVTLSKVEAFKKRSEIQRQKSIQRIKSRQDIFRKKLAMRLVNRGKRKVPTMSEVGLQAYAASCGIDKKTRPSEKKIRSSEECPGILKTTQVEADDKNQESISNERV